MAFLGFALLGIVMARRWRSYQKRKRMQAAKDKEEQQREKAEREKDDEVERVERVKAKAKREQDEAREKEWRANHHAERAAARAAVHDAAVATAVEHSQSVGRLRADISVHLARDAVQSAIASASPIHVARITQLAQQGQAESMVARFTRVVESGIAHALIDCELDRNCRVLSLMARNPQHLPSPSLHAFCRAAVVTAATEALGPFILAAREADAAAAMANGSGMEGVAPLASASACSSFGAGQLAVAQAEKAAASAVRRECAQFASSWLSSEVIGLGVRALSLKRPPSLIDLRADAGAAWTRATMVVVDMPAGHSDANEGGAGSNGQFVQPYSFPSSSSSESAPPPSSSSYSAALFSEPGGPRSSQCAREVEGAVALVVNGGAAASSSSPSHLVFVSPAAVDEGEGDANADAADLEGIELQQSPASAPPGGCVPRPDGDEGV
jgi:hypothetical protein